jgi:hypothetical protein
VESYIRLPLDGVGKRARAIYRPDLDTYEEVGLQRHIEEENPAYVAAVEDSDLDKNKNHLLVWNGSGVYVRLLAAALAVNATGGNPGYPVRFSLYRATSYTGGTASNLGKLDPRDPNPPSGLLALLAPTVSYSQPALAVFSLNSKETGGTCWVWFRPHRPIVVPPGSGAVIRQANTAGQMYFSACVYLSSEGVRP